MVDIAGFMVIKNGLKLGYPFVEATHCLLPSVAEFWLGEGYSDDNTLHVCQRLAHKHVKVNVTRHPWPRLQTGFAIGEATNHLLNMIDGQHDWFWYVQGDELWHPDAVAQVLAFLADPGDYDAVEVNFLHLIENCQRLQFEPGQESYTRAVRIIKGGRGIQAHRDAWTFERAEKVKYLELDKPLVHVNTFWWAHWAAKARNHAVEFYPDLGFYMDSARERERIMATGDVPQHWLARTSPFADYLPEIIKPMLGETMYYVRDELVR